MNDDYLWDGSGEPDPEIQKLENTLAKFRHEGQAPEFPEITATQRPRFWQRFVPWRWSFGVAAATATILFVFAFGILRWSQKPSTNFRAGMGRGKPGRHATSGIQRLRNKRGGRQTWRRTNTRHRQPFEGEHFHGRYWHRQRRTEHALAFESLGATDTTGSRSIVERFTPTSGRCRVSSPSIRRPPSP